MDDGRPSHWDGGVMDLPRPTPSSNGHRPAQLPTPPTDAMTSLELEIRNHKTIDEAMAKVMPGFVPEPPMPTPTNPKTYENRLNNKRYLAKVINRTDQMMVEEDAKAYAAELRLMHALGERVILTAEEFATLPPHPVVLDEVLAAEVNLLVGPPAAGKSLLAREWALSVASGQAWRGHQVLEPRDVVWVASEGLNDFGDRWVGQPGWAEAKARIHVISVPVNLVGSADVDWLLEACEQRRPGLVVFDVIYGMGMADDNGTKDVLPVLSSMKRISAEWGCATLALGHPGHGEARRMRGSSNWRALAYTEWHMADGTLSCEKSKIADASRLGGMYEVEYPHLRWMGPQDVLRRSSDRDGTIRRDIEQHPEDNHTVRAARLAPILGLSQERTRALIRAVATSN